MRIFKQRPKAGDKSFDLMEKQFNITISPYFRNFMKIHAGVMIFEDGYLDENGRIWRVHQFFRWIEMYKATKEAFEAGWDHLPFAIMSNGWNYCISYGNKNDIHVRIYRWHNYPEDEQWLKLCDSFEEFINSLKAYPEDDPRWV